MHEGNNLKKNLLPAASRNKVSRLCGNDFFCNLCMELVDILIRDISHYSKKRKCKKKALGAIENIKQCVM